MNGKNCVEYIGGIDFHISLGQIAVSNHVTVAEHDTLGSSRGPTGKQNCSRLLAIRFLSFLLFSLAVQDKRSLAILLQADSFTQAKLVFSIKGRYPIGIGKKNLHPGKLHILVHILVAQGVVQGNHNSASKENPQVGNGPLRAILPDNGNLVTFFYATAHQIISHTIHIRVHFLVGEGFLFRHKGRKTLILRVTRHRDLKHLNHRWPCPVELLTSI